MIQSPVHSDLYRSGISRRRQPRNLSQERDRWFESGSLQRRVNKVLVSFCRFTKPFTSALVVVLERLNKEVKRRADSMRSTTSLPPGTVASPPERLRE